MNGLHTYDIYELSALHNSALLSLSPIPETAPLPGQDEVQGNALINPRKCKTNLYSIWLWAHWQHAGWKSSIPGHGLISCGQRPPSPRNPGICGWGWECDSHPFSWYRYGVWGSWGQITFRMYTMTLLTEYIDKAGWIHGCRPSSPRSWSYHFIFDSWDWGNAESSWCSCSWRSTSSESQTTSQGLCNPFAATNY